MERICSALKDRIMTVEQAAALVSAHSVIGCSGFTLSGEPKIVPNEIAKLGKANDLTIMTGASVGDSLDGSLARSGLMSHRYPYQSNKDLRNGINKGEIAYSDMHLSHIPAYVDRFKKTVDFAIVECVAVTDEGIVPAASVGAADCYIRNAKNIILEVNESLPMGYYGLHDITTQGEGPIAIYNAGDRPGTKVIPCDFDRVVAVVMTNQEGTHPVFTDPDEMSQAIANHIVDFFKAEVAAGRQPENLRPLQSGVGNVANAVMAGLMTSGFKGLSMYTEVLQDAAVKLIDSGVMDFASTTSVSLSKELYDSFNANPEKYTGKIIIRPQEISNHPEIIRRLQLIAMNTPIECDIYGNVNSTHVMGTKMMNGIGGSGDFARNAGLTIFATGSLAKGGNISCIVPMCSHVDHTEHDVDVIVTEQGLADLRWKSPRERAEVIIENCAHPDYKPALREYFKKACELGGHTPHVLKEALSWHERFVETGSMK